MSKSNIIIILHLKNDFVLLLFNYLFYWNVFFLLYWTGEFRGHKPFQSLSSLQNLTFLDLAWNSMVCDDTLIMMLSNMPLLDRLNLEGLKYISSKPFLPIISKHENWYEMKNRITKRLRSNSCIDQNLSKRDIIKHQVRILI